MKYSKDPAKQEWLMFIVWRIREDHDIMVGAVRVYDILGAPNIIGCVIDSEDPVLVYSISNKEKAILMILIGRVLGLSTITTIFLVEYIFKSREYVFFELRKKVLGKMQCKDMPRM